MLSAITFILLFQVLGELIGHGLGLPVPGPVLGMVLMLFSFFVKPEFINIIRPTGGVLLSNLSLLFVPAGVGIMRHGQRFIDEGLAIIIVIVASTVIAMIATAYTIIFVKKRLKIED